MADSAESTLSPPAPADLQKPLKPQKRRASPVSTDTEHKLARAARDGTTLDLFPDDIARAEQQALNLDVRQGTLQGFELPGVVLAAAGAPDGVGFTMAARNSVRAAAAKGVEGSAHPHDGQLSIDSVDHEPDPPSLPPAADTPPQSAPPRKSAHTH